MGRMTLNDLGVISALDKFSCKGSIVTVS